ncbi:MAG TPA: hypothetical protein VND45_12660, partial [Thermoanaerobaculia bacterium]|nr:hypothetical protein [Thermoanaerobaculia bacterium]
SSRVRRSVTAAMLLATVALAAAPKKHDTTKLRELAADATLLDTVKKQNADVVSEVAVQVIDGRWGIGKESVLARRSITGPCAERMRAFLTANAGYTEAFVLDAQGAIVCANARTANYWYGEQPRWQRAMKGAPFSGDDGIVSVPMIDGESVIGVVTARIRTAAARPPR